MNITRRQRKKLVHLYKQPKFNVGWAAKLQTSQNFVMGSGTCLTTSKCVNSCSFNYKDYETSWRAET